MHPAIGARKRERMLVPQEATCIHCRTAAFPPVAVVIAIPISHLEDIANMIGQYMQKHGVNFARVDA